MSKYTPRTVIGFVIDRSGSMGAYTNQVIEGHNSQLRDIRETAEGQEVTVVRTLFDYPDNIETTTMPLDEMYNLDRGNYRPEGSTALNDAIGETILKLREYKLRKKDAVLLIIFTDGEENSSQKFSGQEIKNMIEAAEETGQWTVTYLGPQNNIREVSQQYGIRPVHMASYNLSGAGVSAASATVGSGTRSYMSMRSSGVTASPTYYGNDTFTNIGETAVDINVTGPASVTAPNTSSWYTVTPNQEDENDNT